MRGARNQIKAWKWQGVKNSYSEWWDNLSIEQKVHQKQRFEKFRLWNEKTPNPYPYIYDLRHLRISQLNDKHIDRIFTFKDHKL